MDGTEKVVKHLEMIQAVIKRLAISSFLVKGGSLLLVITSQVLFVTYVFFVYHEHSYIDGEYSFVFIVAVALILLVLGFWILDGFFLWQERLFRYHYNEVRQQGDTDFNMDVTRYKNRLKGSLSSAIYSVTLIIFYAIELIFVLFLPAVLLFFAEIYW